MSPQAHDRTPSTGSLSVVTPVYMNEGTVRELAAGIFESAEPLFSSVEIVFVNDASPDDSQEVLAAMAAADPRVKVVRLVRNFGQHVALLAGLEHVTGDYVIFMDADLEDPPAAIPALVEKMEEGFEVVVAVRSLPRRRNLRGLVSSAFIRVFNWLSDHPIIENAATMRLMTRRYAGYLGEFRERPFIAGMVSWIGLPVGEVPVDVNHGERDSGYSLRKLVSFARLGLLGFSAKPLRITSVAGVVLCGASILYAGGVLVARLAFGGVAPGFTSIVTLFTFLLGMQFIVLGVIGEYLSETYLASRRRPPHLVYDKLNIDED